MSIEAEITITARITGELDLEQIRRAMDFHVSGLAFALYLPGHRQVEVTPDLTLHAVNDDR